jgi:hypothetical protein
MDEHQRLTPIEREEEDEEEDRESTDSNECDSYFASLDDDNEDKSDNEERDKTSSAEITREDMMDNSLTWTPASPGKFRNFSQWHHP